MPAMTRIPTTTRMATSRRREPASSAGGSGSSGGGSTGVGCSPNVCATGTRSTVSGTRAAAAAAAGIIEVMQDPAKARAWGLAGRQRVEAGFSMDVRISRLEELYREVLAERRQGA